MTRILVSGGEFDQHYGILSIISKTESGMHLESEHIIEHPLQEISVEGKGITGLAIHGNQAWACFSNVLVRLSLDDFTIQEVIENRDFFDLHGLSIYNNHMYVANTGNESVDIINLATKEIERIDLLGHSIRKIRPLLPQGNDTKPHLHHISSVTIDNHENLILGFVRQQRILNLSNWEWIGTKKTSPVHDVDFINGDIWYTTVDGEIANSKNKWYLSDYQQDIGWTRGLAVTDDGFFVGTTAIRESNHDYYKQITNSETWRTGAKICFVDFREGSKSFQIELPNAEKRKVFAIEKLSEEWF